LPWLLFSEIINTSGRKAQVQRYIVVVQVCYRHKLIEKMQSDKYAIWLALLEQAVVKTFAVPNALTF
jgi:hypothetical protein